MKTKRPKFNLMRAYITVTIILLIGLAFEFHLVGAQTPAPSEPTTLDEGIFKLWDTETNTFIRDMAAVDTVYLDDLPSFSVVAAPSDHPKQVTFYLGDHRVSIDTIAPYAIAGDIIRTEAIRPWQITPGRYDMRAVVTFNDAPETTFTLDLTVARGTAPAELEEPVDLSEIFDYVALVSLCDGTWQVINPLPQNLALTWTAYQNGDNTLSGQIRMEANSTATLYTMPTARGVMLTADGGTERLYTETSGTACEF